MARIGNAAGRNGKRSFVTAGLYTVETGSKSAPIAG